MKTLFKEGEYKRVAENRVDALLKKGWVFVAKEQYKKAMKK